MTLSLLRRDVAAPLRIGHRGAAALAPENTLESFERALELGVDGVEFDVVSPDLRKLIVCHEPNDEGPGLDETLAFFAGRDGAILQIDVKTQGCEDAIVDAVRRFDLVERSVVSSFSVETLRAVAALEPRLARSFTFPEDRFGVTRHRLLTPAVRAGLAGLRRLLPFRVGALLARADAHALTINVAVTSSAVVAACHSRGAAAWVWTVNDAGAAAEVATAGADAIITDDPRIFRESFV